MAKLTLRTPWTSQPQIPVGIDKSNPVLGAAVAVNLPSSGAAYNAANPANRFTGSPTFGVGPSGKTLDFNGSSQNLTISGIQFSGPFGWFGRVKLGATSTASLFQIASKHTTDASASDWAVYVDASRRLVVDIPWVVNIITTSATYATGTILDIGLIRTGATGSWNWTLYVNGVAVATVTGSASNPNTSAHSYNISSLSPTTQYTSNTYAYTLLVQGVVPASFARDIAVNPWAIFQPIQRTIWVPAAAGGGTYTLTADNGSYALTGQSTGLAFNRVVTADTQSYALTGQAATLAFNRAMVAASAAYTLAGQDTGLAFNRVLTADTTAYTLTGQNVTLMYTPIGGPTYTLAADSASYALTGQDTGLLFNRVLSAATTAYALTGQATGLARGWTLTADTAAYSLTGGTASFVYNRVLTADSASYALTGQDATLTYTPLSLPTIGRPASDTSNTGWLPSSGSDLYAMIDEVVPDDLDYIYSTAVGQICEMPLDTTSYPGTASQTLKFRGSSSTGNSVIVRLKNTGGATVRTVTQALTATDTEYDITLTSGEIAAITSGSLSVELESA